MGRDSTKHNQATVRPKTSESAADREYYRFALQWFLYEEWSIDEAANLFAGCLPTREMLQLGEQNEHLDEKVLESENQIRRAMQKALKPIDDKKYFAPLAFSRSELMKWALEQRLALPPLLLAAFEAHKTAQERPDYSTPCVDAVNWACKQFWQNADYRSPPSQGEVIQALLKQFRMLDHEECVMVEYVCRHPLMRKDNDA